MNATAMLNLLGEDYLHLSIKIHIGHVQITCNFRTIQSH